MADENKILDFNLGLQDELRMYRQREIDAAEAERIRYAARVHALRAARTFEELKAAFLDFLGEAPF